MALVFLAAGGGLIWYIRSMEQGQVREEAGDGEGTGIRVVQENGRVRLVLSREVRELSGITTSKAETRHLARYITLPARLRFAPGSVVKPAAPFRGRVGPIHGQVGKTVAKGEPLLELLSDELVRAKSELRSTLVRREAAAATYDRLVSLRKSQLVPEQDLIDARRSLMEAEAQLERAEETLRGWGVDEEEIQRVRDTGDCSGRLVVRSPINGVVLDIYVVEGQAIMEGDDLAYVADPGRLWAEMLADEVLANRLRPGLPVRFYERHKAEYSAEGVVVFVAPQVDPATRKVRVFAELANESGEYKAEAYGTGAIEVESVRERVLVPASAIQRLGERAVVFVTLNELEFELRYVETGDRFESDTEILRGITAGEEVVVNGAYLLLAELLKQDVLVGADTNADREEAGVSVTEPSYRFAVAPSH